VPHFQRHCSPCQSGRSATCCSHTAAQPQDAAGRRRKRSSGPRPNAHAESPSSKLGRWPSASRSLVRSVVSSEAEHPGSQSVHAVGHGGVQSIRPGAAEDRGLLALRRDKQDDAPFNERKLQTPRSRRWFRRRQPPAPARRQRCRRRAQAPGCVRAPCAPGRSGGSTTAQREAHLARAHAALRRATRRGATHN
jgi:hypothetical protein